MNADKMAGLLPCPFCGDSEHGEMQMTYMHADRETKGRRIKNADDSHD